MLFDPSGTKCKGRGEEAERVKKATEREREENAAKYRTRR